MKHRFVLQLIAAAFALGLVVLLTLAILDIVPLGFFWFVALVAVVVSYVLHKPRS